MSESRDSNNHRDFPGRRLLINLLRALHLVGVVGTGASVLGSASATATTGYAGLLIATGLGIIALDRWANTMYFRQSNGLWALFKLALLGVVGWLAGIGVALFWLVLISSALMTHAPRGLRHRKLF